VKKTRLLLVICFAVFVSMAFMPSQAFAEDCKTVEECLPLAEQEDAKAQYRLGLMYDSGQGGAPQDYKETVKWYRKAAEQGIVGAQLNLGVMYENGEGVPQDYKEAFKWYRKAAEQGHIGAQLHLGLMYDKGNGVPQDYKETVKWYRKAAEQASAEAQFYLGFTYYEGENVVGDFVAALGWLSIFLLFAILGLGICVLKFYQRIRDLERRQHKLSRNASRARWGR